MDRDSHCLLLLLVVAFHLLTLRDVLPVGRVLVASTGEDR